jgi:hypothetical protein
MSRRVGERTALALLVALAAVCSESGTAITSVSGAVASLTITVESDGPSGMPGQGPIAMEVGDSVTLSATATNAIGMAVSGVSATWSSSAPTVVQVSSAGVADALTAGEADIYASAEGPTATIHVVVSDTTTVPPPA